MEQLQQAVIEGREADARRLSAEALASGLAPRVILADGLIAGMEIVGERFRIREIFLPDVLLAARAMTAGLEPLRPHLEGDAAARRGTVVIGTVEGDLHDIGKNLVGIMLRGAGFEVVDLGNSVPPAAFVAAVRESRADVVGLSALLTTTMPVMRQVVAALTEAGLGHVRTIVGGAPLSDAYAREIGAQAYGYDAARAVELVRGWLG
jgi:5-methyltetrahydrofolate--homocysteine methyltransferase